MALNYFKRQARFWLERRGYIVRKVKYRVEVPRAPMALQKALFDRLGIEQPVIFDVGANVGQVTTKYRRLFPRAEIYCFEPFEPLVAALRTRFAGDSQVHIVPLAVSNRVGSADFHLTGNRATNSLLPRELTARRYFPKQAQATGEVIETPTTTLDAFCRERGIDRVDILKMDIQGGEMMALRGAAELLVNKSLKLIFTESALIRHYAGEALLYETAAFLAEYDFSLYDLYHLYRGRNGQLRYCEAIFVSPELRAGALDTFGEEP